MPLKLNVGLSRKVSDANYGSRGASVNLDIELESGLVGEPGKLRERIRDVFSMVRSSLEEELNGANGHTATGNGHRQPNGDGKQNGHGGNNGQGKDQRQRNATQSQIKALFAICKKRGLELDRVLNDRYRVTKPEQLLIREASELIDELNSNQTR